MPGRIPLDAQPPTPRKTAIGALATSPWAPLIAVAGFVAASLMLSGDKQPVDGSKAAESAVPRVAEFVADHADALAGTGFVPTSADVVSDAVFGAAGSEAVEAPTGSPVGWVETSTLSLAEAVERANPYAPGPAEACVDMARMILCPFLAQIPVVRDVTGQIAVWGKVSCPATPSFEFFTPQG